MNALSKHAHYLPVVLREAAHVVEVLEDQDRRIADLEREADDLGRRNSEILDQLHEVTMQRDALVKSHDATLAELGKLRALTGVTI